LSNTVVSVTGYRRTDARITVDNELHRHLVYEFTRLTNSGQDRTRIISEYDFVYEQTVSSVDCAGHALFWSNRTLVPIWRGVAKGAPRGIAEGRPT
jgi:hypothetical protein